MSGRVAWWRLAGALIGATLAALGPCAHARSVDADTVQSQIAQVLARPEFSTKRSGYEYRYREESGSDDDSQDEKPARDARVSSGPSALEDIVTTIAKLTEALLWTLVVTVIVLLFVYRERWMRYLPTVEFGRATTPLPVIVSGLTVSPASLPDDVAAAALRLWREGDGRGCVSLLYRGALAALVHRYELDLPDSATEADCVDEVRRTIAPGLAGFFAELTTDWQRVAYADRVPDDARIEALCERWRGHFGAVS